MAKPSDKGVLGVFDNARVCAGAVSALRESGVSNRRMMTYSPFPDHHISHALDLPKSKLGWVTLFSAITGIVSGYGLAFFTSHKWGLQVWGKPLTAPFPWLIIGFEFMILFGCLANFITMLIMAGLPSLNIRPWYDARFSEDHFGIFVPCDDPESEKIKSILNEKGAVEVHEHC